MTKPKFQIFLASTSPRRVQIFSLLKVSFLTIAPLFKEKSEEVLSPEEEAVSFAREKLESVLSFCSDSMIFASDTLINWNGQKLGKPQDEKDAFKMLKNLSGQTHQVLTGLAFFSPIKKKVEVSLESTTVKMRDFNDEEIEQYLQQDRPFDKAGSYSLQENAYQIVESLEGDFLSAVGFPLREVYRFLREDEVHISADIEKIYEERNILNWNKYRTDKK